MRPVKGVVTGTKGSTLVIRLESGVTINTPKKKGLSIGKPVLVSYDFTKGKIRNVQLEVKHERAFEMQVEEPATSTVTDIDDGVEETLDSGFLDTGSLQPFCEGFWNAVSGIFEFETQDFED